MANLALSRRALVAGAATSALVGAPEAAAPRADAALLELGRRYDQAAARRDAATDALDAAEDLYVEPPSPEALFYRPSDGLGLRAGAVRRGGRLWLGLDVETIRDLPCGYSCETDDGSIVWCPDARSAARRDEIVAADAAWRAEKVRARVVCGLADAEAEDRASFEVLHALAHQIVSTPAETLVGVLVKARAAGWAYGGVDALTDEIGDVPGAEVDTGAQGLALSAVRDLLRIAARVAA